MNLRDLHEREKRIEFEPKQHVYRIDGKEGFTSVTTKIGQFFPPFRRHMIISQMVKSNKNKMSYQQISDLWESKASFGSSVHELIENYLTDGIEPTGITPDQQVCFDQFLDFWRKLSERGIKCWRPEMRIFSEKFMLAGSIDLLVEFNDGSIELYDWKCLPLLRKNASHYGYPPLQNYPDTNTSHYIVQLNLYKFILEEHYDIKIAAIHLVQLHHTLPTWQLVVLPDNQQSIRDMLDFEPSPPPSPTGPPQKISSLLFL